MISQVPEFYEGVSQLLPDWSSPDRKRAGEILSGWKRCLLADVTLVRGEKAVLAAHLTFSHIYLRGMESMLMLLVNDNSTSVEVTQKEIDHFLRENDAPGRLFLVVALTQRAWRLARAQLPRQRSILLTAEEVEALLCSGDAKSAFKAHLHTQIPRRRLIPYSVLQPARHSMFFGRESELRRLDGELHVSFAIAGPGRIGKTSVALRHRHNAIAIGDTRPNQTFYVDFYECADHTDDGIARFLAVRIDPSQRSHRMTAQELPNFLRYQGSRLGGRLELILDEVDEVCQSGAFTVLGSAAKQDLCRLILCGKGVLLKTMTDAHSSLNSRLQLLRLVPLSQEAARDLLVKPLADLGIYLEGEDVCAFILDLTGNLPHLIQFFGQSLARLALDANKQTISIKDARLLQWDWNTAQFFLAPLKNITSTRTRFVALSLLRKPTAFWKVSDMLAFLRSEGLSLNHTELLDICDDLVINNVLTWTQGAFCVANQALPRYAQKMGYFDADLVQIRATLELG